MMGECMRENGRTIICMGMECILGLMEGNMKVV
jgi:hypothetical protein